MEVVQDFDPSTLYTPESKWWQRDDAFNKEWAAKSKTPLYSLAAPLVMDAEPRKVNLLKYLKLGLQRCYGSSWRWFPRMQWYGTCVGQSHQLIAQGTMAINSILDGTKYPGDPCVADQYAGGRVDVAGQPGRWQGSNGGWSAEWLTNRGGMLLGAELGLPDGVLDEKAWYERNRADEKIAMQWTATRQGVPEQYEKVAKVRPIEGSAMVQTVEEVDAALGNLQFINICTSLIPDAERGQGGISRMRRRGGHSTVIAGNDGPDEYPYLYVQSWWKAYKGPNPYSDPFMADFNSAVCYISRRDLASVLTSRDCFTFWGVQGLEPVQNSFRI